MKLNEILIEVFNVKESEITDSARLMNFESWDSMTHMLFITRVEEVYEVMLEGNEIADMETVGDVRKILLSKRQDRSI